MVKINSQIKNKNIYKQTDKNERIKVFTNKWITISRNLAATRNHQ
jgi:hypothetical protein